MFTEYLEKGILAEGSGKYPELDKIAAKLADDTAKAINAAIKDVESKMPYKAQYVLEEVIKDLKERV